MIKSLQKIDIDQKYFNIINATRGFRGGSVVKNSPAKQETRVQSLGQEDPLEEGMATYSRILAWRIPMDREAWQATVLGVAKSRT